MLRDQTQHHNLPLTTDKQLHLFAGARSRPGQKGEKTSLLYRRQSAVNMSSPPVIEDQAVLLENALGAVRMHANAMRKCLETPGKLMDALKCG